MNPHHDRSIVVVEVPNPRYLTGLLDANGNPIFRTDHKNPIGFVWFDNHGETQKGFKVHD